MDYIKFAQTIHPIYVANDWCIAYPGSGGYEMGIPTVDRLADIAAWAHRQCMLSEKPESYATTARIRCDKKTESYGPVYRFSLEVYTHWPAIDRVPA